MPDHELSTDAEEGFRLLHEVFGAPDPSVPKRRCRRYVLQFRDGEPVFRDANCGHVQPRDEIESMLDQIIAEVFGNDGDDIVPKKLAQAFPGSSFEPTRYGSP